MKKTLLIIFMLAFTALLFSCTSEGNAAIDTTAEVSETSDNTPFELKTAHNGILSDSDFEKVYTWGDYGYERNYVWSNKTIYNVSLLYIVSDGELEWDLSREAEYTLDVLLPGQAVCRDIMVPEGFPSHAFCYEYEGEKHVMAIGYNGRDGGISFFEIF